MKIPIIGAILLIVPLLAYGGEQADEAELESNDTVLEAFVNYGYSSFGNGSMPAMAGSGFDFGARLFGNLNGKWGGGLRFGKFNHHTNYNPAIRINDAGAISSEGMGWTIAGAVYYRYPWKYFQPYGFFGFGGVYKSHVYHFESAPDIRKRNILPAIDLGGGFRVPLSKRLWISPEARILVPIATYKDRQFIPNESKPALWQAGIGITYIVSK
jgi:hypothetical protein